MHLGAFGPDARDARRFVIGDALALDIYGIDVGGTVMIRPDGYVATRWAHDPGARIARRVAVSFTDHDRVVIRVGVPVL